MKHWSFYDEATGDISTVSVYGPSEEFALANAPKGHKPIRGRYSADTQRIDPATGAVLERATPPEKPPLIRRAAVMRQIIDAEEKSGPRAVREALLALLPAGPERERLAKIDGDITALRPKLKQ